MAEFLRAGIAQPDATRQPYNIRLACHYQGIAMSRLVNLALLFTSALCLTGCGAETIGTAAVVATQKQQEIEQGQKLKESVMQQIDAAQALEQQKLKEAQGQ
jgi:hypothetical protein